MHMSPDGENLIKSFEGLELAAYPDPGTGDEPWTIGWGHTSAAGSPKVFRGLRITRAEADEILRKDLEPVEREVSKLVKVALTQNQFDALVSFAFNCGTANLAKSTLLKRVNAKEFDKVPAEFMKWTKANGREMKGLVRRRRAEAAMWRGINNTEPAEAPEARAKPDKPTPKKSMASSVEGNASILIGAGAAGTAFREAKPIIQDAADSYTAAVNAIGTPAVLVALFLLGCAAVIWWRRRQRLIEEES